MSKISFLILVLVFSQNVFAQETMLVGNESFFVYPHKKSSTVSWIIISATNKKNESNIETLFRNMLPDLAEDSSNYNESLSFFKRDYMGNYYQKSNSKTIAYVRANDAKFFENQFNLFQTLTPSIDKIQDGKYVQLYNEILKLDEKGNLSTDKNQIAGFFEIKNNLLEGFSYCINPNGDTLEKGYYEKGKRIGTWTFYSIFDFNVNNMMTTNEKPIFDKVICQYTDGLINGPYLEYKNDKLIFKGNYTNSEASGEWFCYEDGFYYKGKEEINAYYLREHFTYAKLDEKNPKISHKPIIRSNPFQNFQIYDTVNFKNGINEVSLNFNKLFKFYKKTEEDLELPEEKIYSYDGLDYENEYSNIANINLEYNDQAFLKNKYYSKGKLIDSIGVEFLFDGIYEEFYPNGQKKFNYEIKNGEIVKEDTLFWSNGKAANIIEYSAEANEYYSTIFNNKGELIEKSIFDSLGDFKSKPIDKLAPQEIIIDGFLTKYYKEADIYEYDKYDTLKKLNKEKLTFFKSWYSNKMPCVEMVLDPTIREVKIKINAINQAPKMEINYAFGEDYNFFSAKSVLKFKNISTEVISNGSYEGNISKDSLPSSKIYDLFQGYEITDDYQVLLEGKPYSGTFELNYDAKKPSFSFKENSLKLNLTGLKYQKKLTKEIQSFLKTGNSKQELLSFIDVGQSYENNFKELFPVLNDLYVVDYNEGIMFDESGMPMSKDRAKTKTIVGKFQDGKPTGLWKCLDQFGKILTEINYLNGEKQGEAKFYNYVYPIEKNQMDYYGDEGMYSDYGGMSDVSDFPETKTYYLERISNYNKGIPNGEEIIFDWNGNKTFSGTYKDGFLDGKVLEQNKLITNESIYEDGVLDGIAKTKLTLPGKDTIVLYELNFQNHMLQGESKSFHANGNLAKHGFFLNGEPIQDYEAFDSLGTIYHYVKFLYSYPVEEKIWEENELSVRYLFDWKDSIYFRPEDLVNIPSTYDLLYQYGLMTDESFEQPYYGRPSIIDKNGIKYQITKYYPDQKIARDGFIKNGKKIDCWMYYDYAGHKIYEIDYFDTILKINDSIKFKSKGIRTDFDTLGNFLHSSYVIEKIENYDCSHTDHYEIRQFMTISESGKINVSTEKSRSNGYVKNYYDDGTLQSEGQMLNNLPTGVWKYYTPNGQLNQVGEYVQGKRNGRWLKGDLSKTNYLGDICMNPNLPDLEKRIAYQENLLDIEIRYFKLGKIQTSEYYDINMNGKN